MSFHSFADVFMPLHAHRGGGSTGRARSDVRCDATETRPGLTGPPVSGHTVTTESISPSQQGFSGSLKFNKPLWYPVIRFSSSPKSDEATASGCSSQEAPRSLARLPLRLWTIVYAAVSIPFRGFTRHWGLRDCTTLISFVSGLGKREHSEYTLHQYGVEWRRGLSDGREKHCTCPSCSPPTWPSVQRLLFRKCREHSLASKVPLPFFFFFHLCAPAHGQNHGLIFQNMFLACTPPPPPLYTSPSLLPCPHDSPPPPQHHLSHAAHSLFTTYSPPTTAAATTTIQPPHPHPNLPACLLAEMCDVFPYLMFCCSSAPFNPITSAVCFMD